MADLGSSGKHHRRADVRVVGELPVRHRDQASRARGAGLSHSRYRHGKHQPWNHDSPIDLAVVERELLKSEGRTPVQNKEAYLQERHGVQQNISAMETLE